MIILLTAAFAFIATFALVVLAGALSPAQPAPKARKPVITEYRGPIYTAHGREVIRHHHKLRAL